MNKKKLLVITGPTASGKSKLAQEISTLLPSCIINADSKQIYKDLEILTASPSLESKAICEHNLYNFLSPNEDFNAYKYKDLAENAIINAHNNNKLPILTGGSGLYINSILFGMNEAPNFSIEEVNNTKNLYNNLGPNEFYKMLIKLDPKIENKIHPNNSSRIIKSYLTYKKYNKSIYDFRKPNISGIYDNYKVTILNLNPDRNILYQNCNNRFHEMIDLGVIEEVKDFNNKYKDYDKTPLLNGIIGLSEINDYIESKTDLNIVSMTIKQRTRKLAKRQVTWFKHQLPCKNDIIYDNFNTLINIVTKILKNDNVKIL